MKFFFFMFLFVVMFSSGAAKGEISDSSKFKQQAEDSNTVVAELPPEVFSFRGVKDLNAPVKIYLKDNQLDLSFVADGIERVTKSIYDNFSNIDYALNVVYENIKNVLCIEAKNRVTCLNNSIIELQNTADIITRLSNRILYPYWYGGSQNFKEALAALSSNCAAACKDFHIADSIIKDSDSQYHQLYNKIKNKDKKCQENVVKNVAEGFSHYQFPKECMKKENGSHPVCRNLLKHISAAKHRFLELVKLTYGEDALTTTEADAICVECISAKPLMTTLWSNPILDAVKIAQKHLQCRKLKPNEEKTIYSGIESFVSYDVKRELDGSYSIPLVLKFSPSEDYDGPVSRDEVPEYYMRAVQGCMAQANQKMLGPNGERLKINIMPDSVKQDKKNCDKQEVINIKIGSSDMRSNMYHYESDISCGTITHEVLHLLGLIDEYREKQRGFYVHSETGERASRMLSDKKKDTQLMKDKDYKFKTAFDCRVTQKNSVMSSHYLRWIDVYPLDNTKSLLDPGHFNSILYGDCEINKDFNECSQIAYQHSYSNPTCLKKKQWCQSKNILGRNKQKELARIQREIDYTRNKVEFGKLIIKEDHIIRASAKNIIVDNNTGAVTWAIVGHSPEEYSEAMNTDFIMLRQSINRLNNLKEELRIVKSWPDP